MKFLFFILTLLLVGLSHAQKIVYNDVLGADQYLSNKEPFTYGIAKIDINLEITNGKATIMILSAKDFELFKSAKQYKRYTIVSDQPFSSLHLVTDFTNFAENFYIVIRSNNLIQDIRIDGSINVENQIFREATNFINYIIYGTIGGIILFGIIMGIIIYKCCRECCRACCCKKRTVMYVPMAVIENEDDVTDIVV